MGLVSVVLSRIGDSGLVRSMDSPTTWETEPGARPGVNLGTSSTSGDWPGRIRRRLDRTASSHRQGTRVLSTLQDLATVLVRYTSRRHSWIARRRRCPGGGEPDVREGCFTRHLAQQLFSRAARDLGPDQIDEPAQAGLSGTPSARSQDMALAIPAAVPHGKHA